MLLVNATHESSGRREDLIDEDEDGLLRGQLNALSDYVDKLAYGKIGGYEILLLVDGCDV